MDRDTLLRRAAKLAALASDQSSLEEADAAAEALARLLTEHRLSMVDVTAAGVRSRIRTEDRKTPWIRPPIWAEMLASGIARACDCQGLFTWRIVPGQARTTLQRFVGDEADIAVAAYWYGMLVEVLPEIASRAKKDLMWIHRTKCTMARTSGIPFKRYTWTKLRESFLMGAVLRLVTRLEYLLKPTQGPEGNQGRALVLLKNEAITVYIKTTYPNAKDAPARNLSADAQAASMGRAAADEVTLAHGLRGASPTSVLSLGAG